MTNPLSRFKQRPGSRLGWWAVGLAIAYVVMSMIDGVVLMRLSGDAAWRQILLPFYGIFMLLCGLAAGVVGLIAIIRNHERSWLVWLAILPGTFVLYFILGNFLGPEQPPELVETRSPSFESITPLVLAADAKPFVIDTDMAVDDWLAILYLLGRPDVDVKAITVTGAGEAHCDAGTRNALNLVALAGRFEIPVACGRKSPLEGDHAFPSEWRESVDSLFDLTLPENDRAVSGESAVEILTRIIQNSPRKVYLVTLGPLTNVAEALETEPTLVMNLEMITVMGGAVEVPGNIGITSGIENSVAEWNIYVDPHAAAVVFSSGAPITLVPLDATNDTPLTMDFYRRLEEDRTTSVAEFVYRVLQAQEGAIRSGQYYFWDPLAAMIATEEEGLGTYKQTSLVVIEVEGAESGRTVENMSGLIVRVAMSADLQRFETLFLDAINGRLP